MIKGVPITEMEKVGKIEGIKMAKVEFFVPCLTSTFHKIQYPNDF